MFLNGASKTTPFGGAFFKKKNITNNLILNYYLITVEF